MVHVAQDQLQRVLSKVEVKRHLGLTATKMHVVVIGGQGLLQLLGTIRPLTQRWAINQDVMMSGVFLVGACGGHLHPLEAKFHFDRGAYGCSILKIGEIHFGTVAQNPETPVSLFP